MQTAQHTPTAPTAGLIEHEPTTLAEVRSLLLQNSLDCPDGHRLQRIAADHGDKFKAAVNRLVNKSDPEKLRLAKEYLGGVLTAAAQNTTVATRAKAPAQNSWSADVHQRSQGAQSPQSESDAARRFDTIHIYSKSSAICFSTDSTRSGGQTVRIEAANSTGPRQYDWGDKVIVQLTTRELIMVLAVLMGEVPRLENRAHGAGNDKGFKLENQQGKVFCSLFAANKGVRSAPLYGADVFALCDLILKQILKNSPHLDTDTVFRLMRRSAFVTCGNGFNEQ